jgi:hypothetical protein
MHRENQPKSRSTSEQRTASSVEYESPELIWKASQDALQAFNQQITSILERISDGFVALDTSWRFTYLNRKG